MQSVVFFFNDTATTEIYTLSLHDALPILTDLLGNVTVLERPFHPSVLVNAVRSATRARQREAEAYLQERKRSRSEEHTSELQSRQYLVCRLLLEKKLQPAHLTLALEGRSV